MSAPILLGARILIALALYAFLGWALYLSWRALRSQADLLAAQKVPMLNITVTPPDGQPQTLSLQKADILIGREADCDLRPEDTAVSARHTRIMYRHAQWWAEDLGSTNGTLLNDAPLSTATILVNGDTIKCGYTLYHIDLEEIADKTL